jgi:hypothetical protein
MFDFAADPKRAKVILSADHAPQLAAVVDLVEAIPPHLLVLDQQDYAALLSSLAAIRTAIRVWPGQGGSFLLRPLPGYGGYNPVTVIRSALAKCPDEYPTPETSELAFLDDESLRETLRRDISTATSAFSNAEWKPATVMAGSVIEAMLLWVLAKQPEARRAEGIAKLRDEKLLSKDPPPELESWNLHQYVEVAASLSIIGPETATAVRLARGFRNLIHPGRGARLNQECHRGTALVALGALEHVTRDIERRFPGISP